MNKNLALWETKPLSQLEFFKLSVKNQLEYLCLMGHLAPNSHNTQPWRFKISEKEFSIEVFLNIESVLPHSDVSGRQACVSIGACVENIKVAANFLGLEAKIEFYNPDKKKVLYVKGKKSPVSLVKVNFTKTESEKKLESRYLAIFTRKVTRADFDPQKVLPKKIETDLKDCVSYKGLDFLQVTDSTRRLLLSEFQAQADNYVINSSKFSRELGEWLLPNNTESFLGMPGIGFGLLDDQAKRMHSGLMGKTPLQPEDGLKFSLGGKLGLEKSPFIGLIISKKDDVESWVKSGMVFENMFLFLEASKVQLAVHAAIVEVGLINRMFMASFRRLDRLTVLFRAGFVKNKADLQRPHSPRLPMEKVIIT